MELLLGKIQDWVKNDIKDGKAILLDQQKFLLSHSPEVAAEYDSRFQACMTLTALVQRESRWWELSVLNCMDGLCCGCYEGRIIDEVEEKTF